MCSCKERRNSERRYAVLDYSVFGVNIGMLFFSFSHFFPIPTIYESIAGIDHEFCLCINPSEKLLISVTLEGSHFDL